jgi:hypothetical protein
MNDAGLIAHHGHNTSKGRMGDFVDACNKKEIAPGSIVFFVSI